jgi:uncharacterized membrane protein
MEATQSQGQSAAAAVAAPQASAGLSTNAMAALGYFCGIAAVVALVIEPYNKDSRARFHAFQALLFQGTWLVGNIAFAMCSVIIGTVVSMALSSVKLGFVGALVTGGLSMVGLVLGLGMLVMWIYLIVSAANGKDPKLPKLAALAQNLSKKT